MKKFSLDTTKFLINLAIEAYHDEDTLAINQYGLNLVKYINNTETDTQGYIAKDDTRLIISFRGTSSVKDAMTDLAIGKVKYPKVRRWIFKPKVHRGFHKAYTSIRDEILSIVRDELSSHPMQVYCTGHSLGGSLAILMGHDLKKYEKIDPIVYTFGSPKVGNRWFAKSYNKKVKTSYRIVNEEDPVPQLPGFTYKHVNKYALIDDSDNIVINPSFIDRLEKSIDGILYTLAGQSLKEHASKNYKELLEKIERVI
ncbi:MAG: lipase family protein [Candidatus Kariarchaeaceae archaeon]|jgi:predicted lipase